MRCGVIGTISPVAGNNNSPIAHIHRKLHMLFAFISQRRATHICKCNNNELKHKPNKLSAPRTHYSHFMYITTMLLLHDHIRKIHKAKYVYIQGLYLWNG